MSLVAAALLTCGWALNVAAISSCQFVNINSGLGANANESFFAMGLFTVQGPDGYCYVVNWDDWTGNLPYWTNSRMNSARVCGTVAAFIGFTIMITGWFLPCFGGAGKCIRVTIASFAIISCILAGFMFLVNTSSLCSVGCEFSKGGGLAIGAMLSYFFAGCLLCVAPNPEPDEEFSPPPAAAAGQERVTIERTEHPDGTVTVKKITTHPDGSKTVEETTERPDVEAQGAKTMEQPEEPVDTSNLVDAKGY
jgi:hypothetical protein